MLSILSKENRLYLMGFSIIWIIAYHFAFYSNLLPIGIVDFFLGKGYLGVDIFLLVSSFGLCHSLNKNRLRTFYRNRLRRIFPMYLLFLAILLLFFGKYYSDPGWKLFLFQITGISSFRHVDVEWYIPALICIYITFPALYKGIEFLFRKSRAGLVVLILAIEALCPVFEEFVFPAFAQRFAIIIVGIVAYLAVSHDNDQRFLWILFTSSALFAFIFNGSPQQVGSMLLPLVVLGLSNIDNIHLPLKGFFSFCGKHSLELYLAQSLALNQFFLHSEIDFKVKVLISLSIIVALATLFYYFQRLCLKFVK